MKMDEVKFKYIYLILLLLPCLSLAAPAQTIWIKEAQASSVEFKAHVEALGDTHKSYAEIQMERLRKKTKSFSIEEKMKKAQKLYLSGNLLESNQVFQDVTRDIYQGDWSEEERYLLTYALLRQMQFTKDAETKKALAKTIALFKWDKIDPANSDYSFFTPSLKQVISGAHNNETVFSISWKKIFPNHEIVLINGKQVPYGKQIRLPDGLYRIVALSSSHTPFIEVISLASLISNPIKKNLFTKGLCEFQTIEPQWKEPRMKLFSSASCPESLRIKFSDLKPKKFEIKDSLLKNFNYLTQINFYKKNKKWIALGVGVIGLSLVAHSVYRSDSEKTGTVTY